MRRQIETVLVMSSGVLLSVVVVLLLLGAVTLAARRRRSTLTLQEALERARRQLEALAASRSTYCNNCGRLDREGRSACRVCGRPLDRVEYGG